MTHLVWKGGGGGGGGGGGCGGGEGVSEGSDLYVLDIIFFTLLSPLSV